MNPLNLLVLRCQDLEKSRSFYKCFGFSFTRHSHGKGPEHLASEETGFVFELYPAVEQTTRDQTGLGFDASDLAIVSERLVRAGFAPEAVKDNPWGKTFVVRDPDGRRVEVKQA